MSQRASRPVKVFTGRRLVGLTWCGMLLMASSAATAAGDDPVKARGLSQAVEGRRLAETAIERVNSILTGSGRGLSPAWKTAPSTRSGEDQDRTPVYLIATREEASSTPAWKTAPSTGSGEDQDRTPVYLIATREEASSTPAAVPRGCKCIFVDMRALGAWVAAHSAGTGRLHLDEANLLAFMLLHEVGHIATRTAGVQFANGEMSQLNIDPSIAKANEEKADEFATLVIKSRMRRKPASSVSLSATTVSMELGKLSWNMQAYRTLDEFGAIITGKPSVFFDQNYTHPNLAWRVLNANHMIHQTAQTKALLDAFEDARRRGANPEPLFVYPANGGNGPENP